LVYEYNHEEGYAKLSQGRIDQGIVLESNEKTYAQQRIVLWNSDEVVKHIQKVAGDEKMVKEESHMCDGIESYTFSNNPREEQYALVLENEIKECPEELFSVICLLNVQVYEKMKMLRMEAINLP